jgi:hypothetical protein
MKDDERLFAATISAFDAEWKASGGTISWERTLAIFKKFGMTHYRDIRIDNLINPKADSTPTVEIRIHRAQRAPEDYSDLAEFWIYRLANLSLQPGLLPIADIDRAEAERLQSPAVAAARWRELLAESRIPKPERYERFVQERFPSPLRLGPEGHPDVEIRFALYEDDYKGRHEPKTYEILVLNPKIKRIRMGRALKSVALRPAPEIAPGARVGSFGYDGDRRVRAQGIPGVELIDLAQARREIDHYKPTPWRKVTP